MAYLTKHPNSKYWVASFRDATGKRINRSTKIARNPYHEDPKERARLAGEAKRLALNVANEYEATSRGNRTEAQIRATLADLNAKANEGRTIQFHTCRAFLQRWLERAEKTKTAGTLARYRGTVKAFLESLGSKADCNLGDITAADLEAFASARLTGGRSASTVTVDMKTLNAPFALALRQGLILTNPVAAAEKAESHKERRLPFTAAEVAALVATAAGDWKTAILLGAKQGLRLGDAVTLRWSNIDLAEKVIRFRPGKTARKKRDMVLPLHPDVEAHLLTLTPPDNAPDGPLCPTLAQAKPGGRSGLSRQFQQIMADAGIEQRTIARAGAAGRSFNARTFHGLRHGFVTALEAAGVAPDQRMLLAGHSDAGSHARYTHTAVETLRAALGKI